MGKLKKTKTWSVNCNSCVLFFLLVIGGDDCDAQSSGTPSCSRPLVSWPSPESLRSLEAAFTNSRVEFISINVKLVDLNGFVYQPGACPTSASRSAREADVPLHWTVTRGRFGRAFAKLPVAHITLYTLGTPYKGRRWIGDLNVTVSDNCWTALTSQEKTAKMGALVAPYLIGNR